jgi:serine/threonine protein kinase
MRSLSPQQWERAKQLFEAALAIPPEQRSKYLRENCPVDDEVRDEVESLLAEHDTGGFLESPPAEAGRWAEELPRQISHSQLGPYRIIEEVGHGGMGAVYRAERADGEFHREVAIKIVSLGMGAELMTRRLRQERQILAGLDHPNVVTLFDGGTTPDGLSYIVMEFVDGRPITEYCRERMLPLRERVCLFRQVCDAVAHAHHCRVVHRDLKPSNVLVTEQGVPKLLDFGISKMLSEAAYRSTGGQGGQTTRLMTPEYASPEQVRGEPATEATDVYALGVMLYEIISGHLPYPSCAGPQQMALAVCDSDPQPPVDYGGEPADAIRHVVLKALEKDPRQRYATVNELTEDLDRYL